MSIKWPFAILFAGGVLAMLAIGEARLALADVTGASAALGGTGLYRRYRRHHPARPADSKRSSGW